MRAADTLGQLVEQGHHDLSNGPLVKVSLSQYKGGDKTFWNSAGSMTSRISSSSLRNITSLGLCTLGQYLTEKNSALMGATAFVWNGWADCKVLFNTVARTWWPVLSSLGPSPGTGLHSRQVGGGRLTGSAPCAGAKVPEKKNILEVLLQD